MCSEGPPKQSPDSTGQRKCRICGSDLESDAIWCKSCEFFQDDERHSGTPRTRQCRHCGLYAPVAATKCYKCGRDLERGRWLTGLSSPVIGGLTGLASAITLLLGTAGAFYEKHVKTLQESKTSAFIVRIDTPAPGITIGLRNKGEQSPDIQGFQLLVTVREGQAETANFREPFGVAGQTTPTIYLGHTEHAQSYGLVPAGSPRLWNLATSLKAARSDLDDETRNRIANQLLSESGQLTPDCVLQYVIRESAATTPATRNVDPGVEQWTTSKCRQFLKSAYGAH